MAETTFKLPKKQVFIKAVLTNSPYAESLAKHNMRSLNDASITLCPDFDASMKLVKTGLSDEEQTLLERQLGLSSGTLDPFPTNPYWQEYYIKLSLNTEMFNLASPSDYLKYKILVASDKVAVNEDEVTPSSFFYIEDVENTEEKLSNKAEVKVEAVELFNKMSASDRVKIIKIYGYNPENNTDKFIKGKVFEELESNPSKFLKVAGRSKERIHLESLVFDLKTKGVLRERNGQYFYNDRSLGGVEELVETLLQPKNQSFLTDLQERLEFIDK